MGRGMADNLASKGHSLVVYDVNTEAVADLGEEKNWKTKLFLKKMLKIIMIQPAEAPALRAVLRRLVARDAFICYYKIFRSSLLKQICFFKTFINCLKLHKNSHNMLQLCTKQ